MRRGTVSVSSASWTDYVHDGGFEQEIRVARIRNALAVLLAPHQRGDASDCEDGFVVDEMSREEFKRAYPQAKKCDWKVDSRDYGEGDYPIKLDGFVYAVAFQGIDINIVNAYETQWIPSGKTNQYSTVLIVDVQQVLGGLMIANYQKVKATNTTPWDLLEKWWTEVPNMTVPIEVKIGSATFTANGVQKIVPFNFKYPK